MWTSFVNLLSDILKYIYQVTETLNIPSYGLSVVLFTILMRFALLPLDLKAKASTKKINEVQPLIKEINEKYKNDPDKRNQKTMELYQQYKVNPLGGCLPMLIQMPIFFALFAALRSISDAEIARFLTSLISDQNSGLIQSIEAAIKGSDVIKTGIGPVLQQIFQNENAKVVAQLREVVGPDKVAALIDIVKGIDPQQVYQGLPGSYNFLWIKNIWAPDSPIVNIFNKSIPFFGPTYNGLFILPALAGISSFYQMKLTTPSGNSSQTKGFTTIFPLMSVWFCSMYTAAFAVYWVTANIFQIVQQTIYNRLNQPIGEGEKK